MAVYKWVTGSHAKLDAQKVGETLSRIEQKGELTPQAVVDASRRKNAPLHDYFEWRDDVAAEKYRCVQAGYLIRSIEIVSVGTSEPTRAFVSVSTSDEGNKRTYINIERAMSTAGTRDEVLSRALAELQAFKRKYEGLSELASIIEVIDSIAA